MRMPRRILQFSGVVLIFALSNHSPVFAEEESRLPEMFDILNSITQHLKDGNYGTASADLDYLSEIFDEQKGTWLLGCYVEKYKDWRRAGRGTVERVGAGVLGGGTTVIQTYTKKGATLEAKFSISPVASGLGALLNNPLFRNSKSHKGATTKQRRLSNGMTVRVQPNEISGQDGKGQFNWKLVKGEITQSEFLSVAGGIVSPGCVKDIAGG